jgi:hypothetical protein
MNPVEAGRYVASGGAFAGDSSQAASAGRCE